MAQSVKLTWQDNSDNETAFYVYRASKFNGQYGSDVPMASLMADVTEWVDVSVVPGTTYRYRVCAVNSAGPSTPTVAEVEVPALLTIPNSPSGLVALVQ